jgi:cellulose synthase/poly-beta-1,6-N-acetylglucosamine synthase-like glycosyltransferase
MHGLGILLLIGYIVGVVFVFLYCVTQVSLLVSYLRHQKKAPKHDSLLPLDAHLPSVTVQLPIYNELYVVERLIDAIVALDYPKPALEIQLLDDSTDETAALAQAKVQAYQKQ